MKKLTLLMITFTMVLLLSACSDACVGPTCAAGSGSEPNTSELDVVLPFVHINGEAHETDKNAYILFEYGKLRDFVKYQVAYLACTCRSATVNYWNVAFVEITKGTNEIQLLSFGPDSDGHYNPGSWGDSSGAPEQNGVTREDFENDFIPWLVGKNYEDLEGISVFTNSDYLSSGIKNTTNIEETDLIDAFTGTSVSTNNMIRVMKELLKYHEANY